MFVKEDFAEGKPISQVPASWFNSVAKFINNLVQGTGISLDKHDNGSASEISVRLGKGLGLNDDNDIGLEFVKVGSGEQGAISGPDDATAITSGYNDTWVDGTYISTGGAASTDVGVTVPVITGGSVDATGMVFTLNYRTLTFDRNGRLYSVSAEQEQFELDTSN